MTSSYSVCLCLPPLDQLVDAATHGGEARAPALDGGGEARRLQAERHHRPHGRGIVRRSRRRCCRARRRARPRGRRRRRSPPRASSTNAPTAASVALQLGQHSLDFVGADDDARVVCALTPRSAGRDRSAAADARPAPGRAARARAARARTASDPATPAGLYSEREHGVVPRRAAHRAARRSR